MIGRRDEYEKMFRVEQQLWWYRSLHERVLADIQRQFGARRDLKLLDAGCGTGGLLWFLHRRGYTNLHGVDGSSDAVALCRERALSVDLVNLTQLATYRPDAVGYDVIVCNDVFCYFNDIDLRALLGELARRAGPGGLLISNNNAFGVFRGQHDVAVGSTRRFVRSDFDWLMSAAGFTIRQSTYWSLALSPLILAVRQWQALQLRLNPAAETPDSDIDLPAPWLNETLYQIVRLEQKVLPRTPFGSSLFLSCHKSPNPNGD
ncbi:MAG: class I SAM-dependent methyltransferase [Bacteroidetes bacterium]|nr:class I SAM-dependent methyltransferase [Fibrella sp.]